VISTTETSCVQVEVFPHPSVAVQVTSVSPRQKVGGASLVTVTPLQSSLAVAVPIPAATQQPTTMRSGGQEITGGVVSVTVIVCVQLALFPQPSVAVHVRVITDSPAQSPGATESPCVRLATPLQSSVALALPVSAGSVEAEQSMVT
jgi:hypothetical protein